MNPETSAFGMPKIDRQLRDLGCPYPNSDPRSSVWLEGRFHDLVNQSSRDGERANNASPSNS